MDERQLKDILNAEEIPPPSDNARKEAMNLALAAFDEAQQEKSKKRQGISILGRLTGRSTPRPRRRLMERKYLVGGMATAAIALLTVVTYDTVNPYRDVVQPPTETVSTATPTGQTSTDVAVATGGRKTELKEQDARKGGEQEASARQNRTDLQAQAKQDDKAAALKDIARAEPAKSPKPAPKPSVEFRNAPSDKKTRSVLDQSRTAPGIGGGGILGLVTPHSGTKNKAPAVASAALRQRVQKSERVSRPPVGDRIAPQYESVGRDQFQSVQENEIKRVADAPVSTFSSDVDTASYSFMRRMLNRGVLPQKNAVRVEELINYFDYAYPLPETREKPFQPTVTVTDSPWKKGNKLIHIGVKGYDIKPAEKPRSNLVFLLDVSGSMRAADKMPLMVNSMKLLLDTLSPEDTVAIVVYAGAAGTVLEPTKIADKHKILAALDNLSAGGSTAGAAGIRQAYALAESNLDKKAVNRVILATDGDFNVGITNREELKGFVERKRKSGVFLSVLGFGQGNLNDHLMQTLAQNGNGVAAHIDTLNEARKVLVDEATSTLFPIAKDVKLQVEFNPKTVAEYRLIGYETRALKREDFRNDKVDAGDIGAGHTVTAIYEITPTTGGTAAIGESRYQQSDASAKKKQTSFGDEYAFLKIRYKQPDQTTSTLITTPIKTDSAGASKEATWATAVAAFGQILKGGKYTGDFAYDDVIAMARSAKGDDAFGYRAEFINLVRLAKSASALPQR
jgi:Ca-activated chloride channel family protein